MRPAAASSSVSDSAGADLVLGYATGYGVDFIEAFVRSLRAVYSGPAALFVSDDPAVAAFLADHDVEALRPMPSDEWTPQPVVARFADYARVLAERPGVRDVLLTDVRDVVFQGAPFEPRAKGLEVFVEYERNVLADHSFQMKHLRAGVGRDLADQLKDHRCICAGTIVGPADEAARLCRLILVLGAIPKSAIGGGFGIDQASLAAAVGYGLIPADIQDNYRRVATVGLSLEGVGVVDGVIVNPDGGFSPVVHQYDRHENLVQAVRERWATATPDRVRTGPQGLDRLLAKLSASTGRRLPELR
ncbi:hypothetical protein [Brevundimonas lenta]|uniref:Uncharacterized protein n=1 Tax=Brevundimonas lenta TaxID=424796 RepID=A0A7W6JF34_9CAUL|nr:hypothetical protein [Brevundimonas lenta]MBB4083969.1 hypothetical protein [Brevundimonas lenta]